jgi:putative intracellular protease/amidase
MKSLNSLIVIISNNKLDGTTNKDEVWIQDIAVPYFIFKDAGEVITVASAHGGEIFLDKISLSNAVASEPSLRFQQDSQAMYHLTHSIPIKELKQEDFDLVFIVGGYTCNGNFETNNDFKNILEDFNNHKKPIALVGYSVAALVALVTDDGRPFVKGKSLTCFSNTEEQSAHLKDRLPFSLQSKLVSLGALYSKGPDFASYVVVDENLITGQNPASSAEAAKQILSLAHNKKEDLKNQVNYRLERKKYLL